ncbi:hypothetical protein LWI29_031801 [Acer saccharum]|uniref:Uncharacterized protein n=1 Tax=Acer saccharum TaxID=4024 RepID=A0AA39SNK8_ACESA|nr:hypothetical protein LWI29_031801 [Acer saccharum]
MNRKKSFWKLINVIKLGFVLIRVKLDLKGFDFGGSIGTYDQAVWKSTPTMLKIFWPVSNLINQLNYNDIELSCSGSFKEKKKGNEIESYLLLALRRAELLGEACIEERIWRDSKRYPVKSTSLDALVGLDLVLQFVHLDFGCSTGVCFLAALLDMLFQHQALARRQYRECACVFVKLLASY